MANIAPLVMAQQLRMGSLPAPLAGGGIPAGVSFLPDELGGARLVVEAAFGANLADTTEASWVWYDISADVHYDPGIHITLGRQSESMTAPPAQCSFELDNTSNRYTQFNPLSQYWPNVQEGTPIRVRVIISNVSYTRFQGRAIGFAPTPDSTGYHQMITVTAAGVTQVLSQQSNPIVSPLARAVLSAAKSVTLRAYWSMEDASGTTNPASFVSTTNQMTASASVQFSSFDPRTTSSNAAGFTYGTAPLPNFTGGGTSRGIIPSGGSSTAWTVQIGAAVDLFTTPSTMTIASWQTPDSTYTDWSLVIDSTIATNGTRVIAKKNDGTSTTVCSSTFTVGSYSDFRIDAVQSGGNVNVTLKFPFDTVSGTLTGVTLGSVRGNIVLNPAGTSWGFEFAVGHVRVWDTNSAPDFQTSPSERLEAWWGYPGETPNARLTRICSDNNIEFNTLGFYSTTALMGAQENADFMTIARSCETTEAGWLYDGLTGGLSFMAPSQRYDQISQFTVSASTSAPTGEVIPDFWPVPDDFARANKVTITRVNGSSSTFEDTTSQLSTSRVGVYPGNAPTQTNYQDDTYLPNRARWEVHKGTFFGYRWPTVNVNMRKIPDRAAAVAGMTPGLMFTVFPLPTRYQAQYGTDPLNLIAEGWSEFLTQFNWEITFNCSMQDIYNVWKIGDPQFGRLGTKGHTLAGDAHPGDATISLATPTGGALWWTGGAITILVDGIKLLLTGVTGGSSPQTGTLDASTPIPRTIQSGQAVSIWKNGVLRL